MKKNGQSSKLEISMSPAAEWEATSARTLAGQPPRQTSAASAWGEDECDLPPPDSSPTTTKKKDAIDFLLYMIAPPVRLVPSEDEQRIYRGGDRQPPRQTDSPRDLHDGWDIDPMLDQALRRYRRLLEADPGYDYRTPAPESATYPFLPEMRFRKLISDLFKKSVAPYKVGASLYICHQMHFLRKSARLSLSESQYLVDNAPLYEVQVAPHERRGDFRKIGESWGKYFAASHYWAAFVVMAGNPFTLPENALPRFIREADMEEFKRLAATFLHFRRSLRDKEPRDAARRKQHVFRALDTELTRADFGDTLPKSDEEIPHLVADFQWQSLAQYSSGKQAPALRRSRKGTPFDNGTGW